MALLCFPCSILFFVLAVLSSSSNGLIEDISCARCVSDVFSVIATINKLENHCDSLLIGWRRRELYALLETRKNATSMQVEKVPVYPQQRRQRELLAKLHQTINKNIPSSIQHNARTYVRTHAILPMMTLTASSTVCVMGFEESTSSVPCRPQNFSSRRSISTIVSSIRKAKHDTSTSTIPPHLYHQKHGNTLNDPNDQ